MAATKGGTPLSSHSLFLFFFNCLCPFLEPHSLLAPMFHVCVCVCVHVSSKLSLAARVFDRSSLSKGLWSRHGSFQAIKQLYTLKVVTSTFNTKREREWESIFLGMHLFLQAEETGWRDEEKADGEMVEKDFGINGYICLQLRLLV